jgi:hypothetical protein
MINMMRAAGADVIGPEVQTDTTRPMTVEEAVRERQHRLYPDDAADMTERVTQSFRDFVTLAEEKEKQVGKPCTVLASY